MTSKKPLILACCLVAFLTAIIAPACKAMSGEVSFIEICTSFGTIERVPTGDAPPEENSNTPSAMQNACGFCLHDKMVKTIPQFYPREELIANLSSHAQSFDALHFPTLTYVPTHQHARAPPISIHS